MSQDVRSAAVKQVFANFLSIGIFKQGLSFKQRLTPSNRRLLHLNYWFQQIAKKVFSKRENCERIIKAGLC